MSEINILEQAAEAFHKETGIHIEIGQSELLDGDRAAVAVVRLQICNDYLPVYIKKWAAQANIPSLINRIKQLEPSGILVADYINSNMAKRLKESGTQFIDTAGNAYINIPPTYVFAVGNKPTKLSPGKEERNRAFDTSGLKVVFGFLCDLDLVNRSYREIAERTGVAVGTVGWVISGLKQSGYLIERGKHKRKLIQKLRLLERWIEAYPARLKPKLYVGNFSAGNTIWWEDIDLSDFDGKWSGEIAAAKSTAYLRPLDAVIYLPEVNVTTFLSSAKLRKADASNAGNIKIYHRFWSDVTQAGASDDLAPSILIYTDLLAGGDPRNTEVAKIIYEKDIVGHLGQD